MFKSGTYSDHAGLFSLGKTSHLVITGEAVSSWQPPSENICLKDREVHVWCAGLDQPLSCVQSLEQNLSEPEKARSNRFHFEKDRIHYIVARGRLRQILGYYTGIDPRELHFRYSSYGKPALVEQENQNDIRFNVSHSQGLALFVLTLGHDIGVDIEYIRPEMEYDQIAEHFFSDKEVTTLRSLPVEMQAVAFFNCWTRKEAYIKARGEGLSLPLHKFDVSLIPGEPAKLLSTRIAPEEVSRWYFQELTTKPEFAATVVVERRRLDLR